MSLKTVWRHIVVAIHAPWVVRPCFAWRDHSFEFDGYCVCSRDRTQTIHGGLTKERATYLCAAENIAWVYEGKQKMDWETIHKRGPR